MAFSKPNGRLLCKRSHPLVYDLQQSIMAAYFGHLPCKRSHPLVYGLQQSLIVAYSMQDDPLWNMQPSASPMAAYITLDTLPEVHGHQ
ncbi:hypothetical protein DEO72_LG2g2945 [Vigna unguiculata]|uniref:Uncharacterized protein n=1 Tax=Vigna unguiculata TaxID=3917 RepID=A0A4D6L2A6_VIGUN|nr:hypothetical protein DEO72_LG2g2945 [Vigna unguiculata]